MINKAFWIKYILFMFVFLTGLCYFVGFHNSDNCQNIERMNLIVNNENIKFSENNLAFKNVDTFTCYMTGESIQFVSFTLIFWLCLYFIVFMLPIKNEKTNKK